ncbi:hypothetical protein [Neptuniibacter sp.]|uniref:hypothetical protein n=1 Tax=Neptuniibacter sp. TaxID=1962643 RepID=UPI003B5B4A3F
MSDEKRLLQLEGQVQALAQAWLHLAVTSEVAGNHDPEALEAALLNRTWSGHPVEPHAQQLMSELVDELAKARDRRRQVQ